MTMPFRHGSVNWVSEPSSTRSVRAENSAQTRQRIIDAVVALVTARSSAEISMPEVAEASGVALRTLYRYFPTRQDLIDTIAAVGDQTVASDLPAAELTLDDLAPWLIGAWQNLLAQEVFIRAQHTSPNGAAIRRARIPLFREVTTTLLLRGSPQLGQIPAGDLDGLVDTVLLLTSSAALFEFLDVLERPVERAAELAADAIRATVAHHLAQLG